MAAPLTRGRGDRELADALARVVRALLDGPIPKSRGLGRLALRRALTRLLDAVEALALPEGRARAGESLVLALHWLDLAGRAERRGAAAREVRDCRARLAVLARRVPVSTRGGRS